MKFKTKKTKTKFNPILFVRISKKLPQIPFFGAIIRPFQVFGSCYFRVFSKRNQFCKRFSYRTSRFRARI